jgi:hypothetical protein
VCGLVSKLNQPDFESFIQDYDLVCLSETKLSDFDSIAIPGFEIMVLNRNGLNKKSGGIAVLIRSKFSQNFKQLKGDSNYVLWFACDLALTGDPIVFGAVYIPPQDSPYYRSEHIDLIEQDLVNLTSDNDARVCLLGDFNARTGLMNDFVLIDDFVTACVDTELNALNKASCISDLGFDLDRCNRDLKTNNSGHRLVEMCKNFGIHIVNGRCGADRNVGKLTCKNASTVDYVVASPDLFPLISGFEILHFDPLLSDIHNPVKFDILVKFISVNNEFDMGEPKSYMGEAKSCVRPVWKEDGMSKYIDQVRNGNDNIEKLIEKINNTLPESVDKSMIDTIVGELCDIICGAARDSEMFVKCSVKRKSGEKSSKPWFNRDCRVKRSGYNRAKGKYRRTGTAVNRDAMVTASKVYKKEVRKQLSLYNNKFCKTLRKLRSTKPKDYWSMLNKGCSDGKAVYNKLSLEVFHDFFKDLSEKETGNDEMNFSAMQDNSVLDRPFDESQVETALRALKNGKSCGADNVLNEYLKYGGDNLICVLTKLFNLVLESGLIPEAWAVGIIIPIYKGKGDIGNPDNHRGITLLSCVGKLFTGLLNQRLTDYLDDLGILELNQAGFRKGHGTTDHIFTLKCLMDMFLSKNKRMYCAFVDYRKAFDTVDRTALWHKLLSCMVTGKFFKVVHNMYKCAKSCVKINQDTSAFFHCNIGVRQGENLSPLLFSLFLNDLELHMSKYFKGLSSLDDTVHETLDSDDVETFLRLYVLLYADDTILLAETEKELQAALDGMLVYCNTWGLQVNIQKTKVMVVSKGKIRNVPTFYYNGSELEVVSEFSYLGVVINHNGRFCKAKKHLVAQARKAMFSILRKARKLMLPIDLQL